MTTERLIGIDFGTSTSFVKVKRYVEGQSVGGDRLETRAVVFDGNGSIAAPTVVQVKDSQTWYGYEAEAPKPGGVIHRNFKVALESGDPAERALARDMTERFFQFLHAKYEEQKHPYFGEPTDAERTLVSYPAKWGQETGAFMVEAARKAGFPQVTGLDEATAAIGAVMVQNADALRSQGYLVAGRPMYVLLIDMGAGTTDLALCRYTVGNPPKNEILSIYPTADSPIFFGGSRVDELLCRFLGEQLTAGGLPEAVVNSLSTLRMGEIKSWKDYTLSDALTRKEAIDSCSVIDGIYMMMGMMPPPFPTLDRAAFQRLMGDYLRQFPELINGCLSHAAASLPGFSGKDVDLVVLTGGHSQWYFVKDMLSGALTDLGAIDLPKLRSDPERMLRMARPQETVSQGLVLSPLWKTLLPDAAEGPSAAQAAQPKASPDVQPRTFSGPDPLYNCDRQGPAVYIDGYLYYIGKGRGIYCINEDGQQRPVDAGEPYDSLYAAEGCLFARFGGNGSNDEGTGIVRFNLETGKRDRLTTRRNYGLKFMRVVDGVLYYSFNGFLRQSLYAKDLKTGLDTTLFDKQYMNHLSCDESGCYFTKAASLGDSPHLYRAAPDRQPLRYVPITMLEDLAIDDFQIQGDLIYNNRSSSGINLYAFGTDESRHKVSAENNRFGKSVEQFVIDDGWVYFIVKADAGNYYNLYRQQLHTEAVVQELLKGDIPATRFALIGDWIYYNNGLRNAADALRCSRIYKDGSTEEVVG